MTPSTTPRRCPCIFCPAVEYLPPPADPRAHTCKACRQKMADRHKPPLPPVEMKVWETPQRETPDGEFVWAENIRPNETREDFIVRSVSMSWPQSKPHFLT